MRQTITIVGAGAIGGTVGAYLARAGVPIRFVDRDQAHVEAMQQRGLTLDTPDECFTVPVEALSPEALTESLGTVLLAVKTQDTEAATQAVAPLLAADGMIVSLQNGLCEHTIAAIVGPQRTVGAFVNFSADFIAPGRVRYFGPGDFYVGEIDGTISARARGLARLLSPFTPVQITDNIWGFLWAKLAYACMLFATALVDANQADVIDGYRALMIDLASEICEVALKERVRLLGFHGFEPDLYVPRDSREPTLIVAATDDMLDYMRLHQKPRSGIWRDIAVRRRKTDVDHSIGLATRIGAGHGLALPLTRRLISLVHAVEDGSRSMGWHNVEILESLRVADVHFDEGTIVQPAATGATGSAAIATNKGAL